MKPRYFLLLLIISACQTSSNDNNKPSNSINTASRPIIYDFNGNWKWNENQEGQHIFELVLEQKDSFVNGYICAISETADGQRIDCGYGDGYGKFNLSGPIKDNVIQAQITSAFSGQSGEAMVIHNKKSLRWTILKQPGNDYMEDYFFPNEAVLLPDDRKELRDAPYRKAYIWENK